MIEALQTAAAALAVVIAYLVGRFTGWRAGSFDRMEMERWRVRWQEYRRWLASEHGEIALVLDNLKAEVDGSGRDACWPPGELGPWGVDGLREVLRRRETARRARDAARMAADHDGPVQRFAFNPAHPGGDAIDRQADLADDTPPCWSGLAAARAAQRDNEG